MNSGGVVLSPDTAYLNENEIRDAEVKRRQTLMAQVAFTFSGITFVYLVVITALLPGVTPAKVVTLLASLSYGAIGWFCQYRHHYIKCGLGIVFVTLSCAFAASLTNGGLEGYVTPVFIATPIAAALFLNRLATAIATASVIGCFVLQIVLENNGFVSPTIYSPEVVRYAALYMLTFATIACAAGLSYFAQDSNKRFRSLITAHRRLYEMTQTLDHSAHHDPLTGLANRKKLQKELDERLADVRVGAGNLCVFHIDLDKFKEVNDTQGHLVGDGVLQTAAKIMTDHFRKGEMIARIGGDEFIVLKTLSPEDNAADIQESCEKLIKKLRAPMRVMGIECQIGASMGYVYSAAPGTPENLLIGNADIALYEAKRSGGGVAYRFTSVMRQGFEDKIEMIAEIEKALAEDRIECVLQPQVSFATGEIVGAEALCRVNDPEFGLCLPEAFFSYAEDAGVIDRVDWLVMKKALRTLTEVRAQGIKLPCVSLNVSAKSLRSARYASHLNASIKAFGLTASDVVVEVLETLLIQSDTDQAAITIRSLRALGIRVVIDDFGTGQTSLGNLAKLEIDGLKIDRSLVPDVSCARSVRLAKAVLTLSASLDVPAVFEGIETVEQYRLIQEMGCEGVQGFFVGKPMNSAAFIDWCHSYGKSEVHRLNEELVTALGS